MNPLSRGARNAFRNATRTLSIVIILGLSISLALSMLLAHQAVNKKIEDVKASVGNTIAVSPAGFRGGLGGGNPLTQTQLDKISGLQHVKTIEENLTARLTSSDTNLLSAVDLGSLGQKFFSFSGGSSGMAQTSFTPPITAIGSNNPTDLNNTAGGGSFSLKSGSIFDSTSSADVALVGSSLASKNNLSVGSSFTVYGATIKVAGIFDSGNTFSNNLLVMPLTTLQKLSGQSGGITSAIVTVDSAGNVSSVTTAIKNKLGTAADVTSSQSEAQSSIDSLNNIKSISLYSLIGAIVAGAVIIFLVMLMVVRERRREIGVLKSIGASNLRVVGQFMVEAVTLTLVAAIIGIAISIAMADPITHTLVNNSSNANSGVQTPGFGAGPGVAGGGPVMMQGNNGMVRRSFADGNGSFVSSGRGLGRFRSSLTNINADIGWSVVAYGLGAAFLIAIVGSTIASFSISKVKPAEVLRTE